MGHWCRSLDTMLLHLAALLSAASSTPPNDVVVVVIDDMGIETLAQYGVPGGTDLETPTLDRLIAVIERAVLSRYAPEHLR